MFFVVCGILLVALFEPTTQLRSKRRHDAECATDNVAERHGKQILGQELADGNFGPTKHTQRNNKHVGYRVVQSLSTVIWKQVNKEK